MKIITSNTARGAYRGVLEVLKKNLETGGGRHIVVTSDRFTASVEMGLMKSLNVESTLSVEVTSFMRLADKELGRDVKKCLTPEGAVMLLGRVISQKRDELAYYKNSVECEGLAGELYAAVTALRNSGISCEKLKEAAEKMPMPTRLKILDLALIYNGYLEALQQRHSDSTTKLDAYAAKLLGGASADAHFYVVDFYGFKAPEIEILRGLNVAAQSLTIGITSCQEYPNRRIYCGYLVEKLKNIFGANLETVRTEETLCAPIDALSKYLFSYESPVKRVESDGKVLLRVARNKNDEILRVALDIAEGVRRGKRFSDYEVFAGDLNEYAGEIKRIFTRYGIPFFIDKKEKLEEQTKARYLLSALEVATGGYKGADVIEFIKNPLFINLLEKELINSGCAEDCDGSDAVFMFENYVLKYNINYSRFKTEFTVGEESDNKQIAEFVREILVKTLKPFGGVRHLREHVLDAENFLENAEDAWKNLVEELESVSLYYSKCAEQVDAKLSSVLEEICEITDDIIDLAAFKSILREMIKTLKISLVPTYLDCVFFGDGESRYLGTDSVYVVGANYGKLPVAGSGGAVLSEKDEKALEAVGLEIVPDSKRQLYLNMLAVCEAMKKPHGRLTVSYCESSDNGALRPSAIISEIKGLICENGQPIKEERVSLEFSGLTDGESQALATVLFSTKKACIYEVMKNAVAGRAPLEDIKFYGAAFELSEAADKAKLERSVADTEAVKLPHKKIDYMSVSGLERYYSCPYSYYLAYILRLKRRQDGNPEGTENGILMHAVLEKFFSALCRGEVFDAEKIKSEAFDYFDKAVIENKLTRLAAKPETARTFARLKEEGAKVCTDLYEIYLRSKFKPYMLEARIGGDAIAPLVIGHDDKKTRLIGKIDRIDVCGDNFLVIDYKTYRGAGLSLSELYYGEKLQLYVYMRAVADSLGLNPKGVFYLPVFAGFAANDLNRYKYKGQVCDDPDVLTEIDNMFSTDPSNSVVPYKAGAKGKLSSDVHLSSEGFSKLSDYVAALAEKGVEFINGGYFKPSPIAGACDVCDFADICGYKGCNERKPGFINASVFGIGGGESDE